MIPERYKNVKYEDAPQKIREMFENIPITKKGLYIHGDVGTGKTHIVHALTKHSSSRFYNITSLLRRIRADFSRQAYDRENLEEDIIGTNSLVIIDDIGSEKISDWVSETFYHIINQRYNDMKPMIFTSNFEIKDLAERIGDRTTSRIVEMCDVVELVGKDHRLNNKPRLKVEI